jgi:hypothetical protein
MTKIKDNFNELLNTNSVNLKTNIDNILTLSLFTNKVYLFTNKKIYFFVCKY